VRVVKPNQIGILSRPYDHHNKFRLGVTGLILFPFAEPRYPMTESALWLLVGKELGEAVLDESMPKHHGEILMLANAYAPGGKPLGVVRTAVELDGRLLKEVAVVGDRTWKDGVPTEPEPFVMKNIRWEGAFGGENFKLNPLGKGASPKEGDPLPNIEDPRRFITSMRQTPEPVGVGPYDIAWPQRMGKAGNYDRAWLDKYYPGLATNIDWTFFNVGPDDQQIPGFFRGDEELVFKNMHPEKAELRCKLPEVDLRCFMRRRRPSGEEIETEVEMRLDTLWLFPHASHGILVFHGSAPIREDDASDVTLLYMACEDLGQPKPIEHYKKELERRLSKEYGAIAALDDRPLMPRLRGAMDRPPSPVDEMADHVAWENLTHANMMKKGERNVAAARAVLIEHGLDPDQHGPSPIMAIDTSGSVEELLARAEKIELEMIEERKKAEEAMAKKEEELRALCATLGVDFDEIQKEWKGPFKGGPPTPAAENDIARLKKLAEDSRAAGFDASEIDEYLADPSFVELIHAQDKATLEAYRAGAQDREAADLRAAEESRRLREELVAAHARGESLAGRDLTGADLSGIELPGANLDEALMERCDLSKANLSGAKLTRAVLVRANLSRARLDGADLSRANLSKAECVKTSFEGCRLTDAMLLGSQLVEANLDGVIFERATLNETRIERCSMRGVNAEAMTLDNLDLTGTSFAKAVLTDAVFMRCGLDRVDFTDAELGSATFYACRATGAIFAKSRAKNLRVVESTALEECNFREADLEEACLRGTSLARSDFTGARVGLADFSECNMEGACLYHVVAPEARFIRTNLRGAKMIGADLFEAILAKADVGGTDLSGANLYQADMAMVRGDNNTKLRDTIRVRARFKPLYSDKVQDIDDGAPVGVVIAKSPAPSEPATAPEVFVREEAPPVEARPAEVAREPVRPAPIPMPAEISPPPMRGPVAAPPPPASPQPAMDQTVAFGPGFRAPSESVLPFGSASSAAPGELPPAAVTRPAPVAPPKAASDQKATIAFAVVPDPEDVLPFSNAPQAEPRSAATGQNLPFAPVPALNVPSASSLPGLTLEQYALLYIELWREPARAAEIRARYGVANEAAWASLHSSWQERFNQDSALRQRWSDYIARGMGNPTKP
jgi:uncharacterized protein YjbI with pentapeptide repeats